jgi:hypothetical protein
MDACKKYFRQAAMEDSRKAVLLLNDDRLLFTTLFVLQPTIYGWNLTEELSERNRIALNICDRITEGKGEEEAPHFSQSSENEAVHQTLLWMFQTGAPEDGLSNEFDQILDITASAIIKTYHDESILPTVAKLIFQRNRRGSFHHDLVWAFLRTKDVYSLKYIAAYLNSNYRKDVELAHTLLHFNGDVPQWHTGRTNKYAEFLAWLQENGPFLSFTDESFQFTNSPNPCSLNLEAKYLNKQVPTRSHQTDIPYTEEELDRLKDFKEAQHEERLSLARYSHNLYGRNQNGWNQWIHYPVSKQLEIAKYGRREFI